MNYSEVFDDFLGWDSPEGFDDSTKLSLLLDFMDRHSDTVVTPEMFRDYLFVTLVKQAQDEDEF